ncbi:hypothetical protein [Aquibacillus saliphilus]|uniref:hypothetical protein n=1 Tax=Aquibacillus saliphilus TaxID=1909422 RepID=UPI001CEFF4A7|nr:hypothetical protein [Aquibacillus saliphilus]
MRRIKVSDYEIIEDFENGTFKALRHGEEWRNLIGDNLILALIDKVEDVESLKMSLQSCKYHAERIKEKGYGESMDADDIIELVDNELDY